MPFEREERTALNEREATESLLGVLSAEAGGSDDSQAHGGAVDDEVDHEPAGGEVEEYDEEPVEGAEEYDEPGDPEHDADEDVEEYDDEDLPEGPLDFAVLADELGISPEDVRLTVKVEGREEEITLQDALNDYSGQAASTRRFQEASEIRKTAEERLEAARALEDQVVARYGERLQHLEQALEFQIEEPGENASPQKWMEYQKQKSQLDKVRDAIEQHQQQVAQRRQQLMASKVAEEQRKLVEAIPSWANDDVRQKEQAELISYAKSVGMTDQDLANLVDHRAILLLRKAQKYDALQQGKGKVREKAKKARTIKPGNPKRGQTRTSRKKAVAKARERLRSTRGRDQLGAAAEVLKRSGILDE